MTNQQPGGEVLFEFHQAGPQVRVAAIDVATGIEVVVIAPASATQMQMKNLALAKLRRRIEAQG
ncbi:serine hydroxymethyltransferase [Pelagibacterium sp. 26DY04]|uniref:DUF6898 family protein n=1 Tax=unclassified Pelagibacterium TaxID=2623280 RepID=UPI002814E137|nr:MULTISPECIES: serine hydroxymethyltransferase [unclassified Pelagibacterium]WMT88540.1 serine hydroxymethyltransferase [Pelagibacterium sp. 26DY04]WMT90781.1 serine hydroxymethyltransferase [Pelagibacterium sp. H642]